MSKARIVLVSSNIINILYRGGIDSKCKIGYKGRMCNECNHNESDGNIYGKTGAFTCQICPNLGV